ncbi:MAG: MarR family transcriptional regulator [Fimbriimonadaceae bacterium]|nr:MarR family transcriptional regulator [Alphaproteobacteria bacterium]
MDNTRSEIVELLERISRAFTVDQYSAGLKPVQWETLRYLKRANKFSRMPGALTAYLGVTKGTVSQTLMALQRNGYVRKDQDAKDKRLVRLELMKAGQDILDSDPATQMAEVIDALPEQSQYQLAEGLKDLLRIKLEADGKRPFGICATCRHFRRNDPKGAPHRCALLDEPLSRLESEQICAEHARAA